MGLFRRLLQRWDPTAHWRAEAGLRLEVDLDRHALCGVRLGDPVRWLEKLGPAEDRRAARRGQYRYYSRGFDVQEENGTVDTFYVIWGGLWVPAYRPFVGRCINRGRELRLSADSTEEEIIRSFGPPYWRDRDEDEILLFYEHGEVEWQVELNLDERLQAILMVTPPLLADAAQRRAYRVTKPWPS